MNTVLVVLAAAIAVTWFISERQEEKRIEEETWMAEREERITANVRAYARKYKRIDFIVGE